MRMATQLAEPCNDPTWDRKVGAVWSHIFLANEVDPGGDVVEVGPGFTLKVVHGLRAFGFRGTFNILEPNLQARQWVLGHCKELLPNVNTGCAEKRVGSFESQHFGHVDALVMNHLLDDLVLETMLDHDQRSAVFGGMWAGTPCHKAIRDVWHTLRADDGLFESVSTSVLEKVCALVSELDPRLFVASQYPSWFQRHNDLEFVDDLTAPLLARLARQMEASTHWVRNSLEHPGAAGDRWLVMRNIL